MRRYLELGKLDPAPISGYEMGTCIDAGNFSFDLEERCAEIERRTEEVTALWESREDKDVSDRPRLLVTGCPNAGVREKIIRAVEELAAAQSFEQVVTHVYHTNRIALAMFESAGFTQIGPPKGGNIFLRKRYMRSPFLA